MIGMNTTESSNLTVYFVDRAVDRIAIHSRSNGVMYPMEKIDPTKMYLPNYQWFGRIRPTSPEDVFFWRGKRDDEKLKKSNQNKTVPAIAKNSLVCWGLLSSPKSGVPL
jgi:hypothetical protein